MKKKRKKYEPATSFELATFLMAVNKFQHSFAISDKIVFLNDLNQNIANIFNNYLATFVLTLFFNQLKLSPNLFVEIFENL